MDSGARVEIIDVEGIVPWFTRLPDPSDPLFVYIAVPLTKTLPGDPHRSLADAVEAAIRDCGMECQNPARVTPPGSHHSPAEIYALNYSAVTRSDVILFIRIAPSVGMGEEAQVAANHLVPCCQLKSNDLGSQQSPVLLGLGNVPCGEKHTICIDSPTDTVHLCAQLKELITSPSFVKTALQIRDARRRAKRAIEGGRLGMALRRQRLLVQLPLHRAAQRLGVSPRWVDAVESDSDVQCGISLTQLVLLANVFHGRVAICSDGIGITIEARANSFAPEVVALASEFADMAPDSLSDPQRAVERDGKMQQLWRLWATQEMGRVPDVPKAGQLPPVDELRVELMPPMSNLGAEEKDRVDQVCAEVIDVLKHFSPIRIKVSDPRNSEHFISESKGRHDFGEKIYRGTVKRILKADLVISVLSPPATGVGIMSQVHADATIPRIAIVADDPVSRMYMGLPVALLGDVLNYRSSQEIRRGLHNLLMDNWQVLAQSAALRRDVIRRIARAGVARAIHKHRLLHGQTLDAFVDEASRRVDIAPEWLKAVATDPELSATLTLIQMVHIAQALDWKIVVGRDGVPCWDAPAHEDRKVDVALSNLVVACEEMKWPVKDETLFVEWQKCEMDLSTDRQRDARAYTVRFWKNLLFPESLFHGAA